MAERARNEAIQENSGLLHPSDTKRVRTLDEEIANLKEIVTKDPVSKINRGTFCEKFASENFSLCFDNLAKKLFNSFEMVFTDHHWLLKFHNVFNYSI